MFRTSPPPTKLAVRARPTTKTNGFHASDSGLIKETTKNGGMRAPRRKTCATARIGRDSLCAFLLRLIEIHARVKYVREVLSLKVQ